jgi:hypothetical protein
MTDVLATMGDGFWNAFLMAWEVWWALVLGFAISAVVQAWVPRRRIEVTLAGGGSRPGGEGDGPRRRLLVLFLCRDRDRQVAQPRRPRYHLCSEHCRHALEAEPERYARRDREVSAAAAP